MGKRKAKPHRHLGRVVASVDEHRAETQRSVRTVYRVLDRLKEHLTGNPGSAS